MHFGFADDFYSCELIRRLVEVNGIEMIENIAKDIRNREDKEMAMAFTNVIGTLLVANGVTVQTSKYELRKDSQKNKNEYMIEKKYGITIDSLDFSEHDREQEEKIKTLERKIKDGNFYITQLKHDLKELKNKSSDAKKINLNDRIRVRLTPLGVKIFYSQFDELNLSLGREVLEPHMPAINKDGYTEMQLWHFIQLYGPYIGVGRENVIEPLDIIFIE